MKPLLAVMNPREIPECMLAISSLAIDKVWFEYMTEAMIVQNMPDVIRDAKVSEYTHVVLLSDDTVPTQEVLDLVLVVARTGYELKLQTRQVVTGFCNLDSHLPFVNLTKRPFRNLSQSVAADFDFFTREEIDTYKDPPLNFTPLGGEIVKIDITLDGPSLEPIPVVVRSWFAGACLTCMPTYLWERYPFQVLGGPGHPGYSSDWCLSTRLQRDGVPIVAPKGAFIRHAKEEWNQRDRAPEKRLLIGERPANVRWDRR